MRNISLLASVAILLGWTSHARAQASLGSPMPRSPAHAVELQAPVSNAEFRMDNRSRICSPLCNHVTKHRFTPLRSALAHLFPAPPIAEPASPPGNDVPTREDIGRMISEGWYSPAEVSAAKIKLDEAQSASRCAAVRYLATVDCHYYPEAELGLIAALRADRVEAVRLEAALALGQFRGLTMRLAEALQLTAQGMDTDGNPAETSERVRTAARAALQRHWSWTPPQPMPEPPPMYTPPDWYRVEPQAIQPTRYLPPSYASAPMPMSPALAQERERAEKISTQGNAPSVNRSPRSFVEFLAGFTLNRDGAGSPGQSLSPADRFTAARMQGLRPLGSESILAIPRVASPYNNRE